MGSNFTKSETMSQEEGNEPSQNQEEGEILPNQQESEMLPNQQESEISPNQVENEVLSDQVESEVLSDQEDSETLPNPSLTLSYRCVSLVVKGQPDTERGGKLLLPSSALEIITFLNIPFPLMFRVTNRANNRFTHAGVLEFTAEEGHVHAPQWMLNHLGLEPGDRVKLETVTLPSATFCRVDALSRNFAYVSDVKALLENKFKNFACLTEGDIFYIYERSQSHQLGLYQLYKLRIAHTEPESAVNIFECDLEFDYSIPKEISYRNDCSTEQYKTKHSSESGAFQGTGYRLDGSPADSNSNTEETLFKKPFVAFSGTGLVLKNNKRKADDDNCNDPPKKRKIEDDSNKPNELIFIRDQQKEHSRNSSSSTTLTPFQGQGHSLKDD